MQDQIKNLRKEEEERALKNKDIQKANKNLKFPILRETSEKYYKTQFTDTLALLCQLSYSLDDHRSTIKNKKQRENMISKLLQDNQIYNTELANIKLYQCNEDGALFTDFTKKYLYIIFRGTDPGDSLFHGDLKNDVQIAVFNKPAQRLANLERILKNIIKGFERSEKWTIIASGHSLGGSLAETLTIDFAGIDHCESFNPGTSYLSVWKTPIEFIKNLFKDKETKQRIDKQRNKIISHHFSMDPISMGPYFSFIQDNVRTHQRWQLTKMAFRGKFPHSMSNFIDLVDIEHNNLKLQVIQQMFGPFQQNQKKEA